MSEDALPQLPDHARLERVRAISENHWLGSGLSEDHQQTVAEIRRQYFVTAGEYYTAAISLYDSLTVQSQGAVTPKPSFSMVNRNVQLFLAYVILWESFKHIYTAASATHFAQRGPDRAPLEEERTMIDRVLKAPILSEEDLGKVGLLKNGETASGAITRMLLRSSRELKEIYGDTSDHTLTDMDAFIQGLVEVGGAESQRPAWIVRALDDGGRQIDPDSPFSAEKYRSVIKWHCYQIRHNINFVGKSASSIDDAILIIRAFCLLDPVVGLLLHDSRKALLFSL